MSHSSINDKLRQLARDIQAGVDNSELVKAIAMPSERNSISNIKNIDLRGDYEFSGRLVPGLDKDDPSGKGECAGGFLSRCIFVETKETGTDTAKTGGDYSVTKHTGWLVLQRIKKQGGGEFMASSFFDSKEEADMFASNFDNVVAIMPIEWEE